MRRRGFTLIEMLLVLMVIAVLAAVVLPRLMNARRRAKDEATREMLVQLNKAVEYFEADVGCFPTALADLLTRPSGSYTGKGIAGTSVVDITVTNASTLWRGPYLRGDAVPPVPLGTGSWSLVTDRISVLAEVNLSGVTGQATDGTDYTDW